MTGKSIAPYKQAIGLAKASFVEIASADGNLVSYKREALFAMQAIERNDKLMECSQGSIRDSVINVASVGLSLNPATSLAFLVPRGGVCCLDVSYRGLIKLATDSGSIKLAKAEIVHAHDVFNYKGPFDLPDHEYSPFSSEEERGAPIGVYCAAKTVDGDWLVDAMAAHEIQKVRNSSKSPNSPAWKLFELEMWKKVIIKRAQKVWPKTERLSKAIHVLNQHEGLADENLSGGPQDAPDPYGVKRRSDIEGEAVTVDPETGEVVSDGDDLPAPLTDGQIRVIKSKLKAADLKEEVLFEQFGVSGFNELALSQINDILGWIGEKMS